MSDHIEVTDFVTLQKKLMVHASMCEVKAKMTVVFTAIMFKITSSTSQGSHNTTFRTWRRSGVSAVSKKSSSSMGIKCQGFLPLADSMVALGWIRSEATRFKTYIVNRVDQILELTNAQQ